MQPGTATDNDNDHGFQQQLGLLIALRDGRARVLVRLINHLGHFEGSGASYRSLQTTLDDSTRKRDFSRHISTMKQLA